MRTQRQKGIALITALFVLILVTAMAVGMCWMVMTDQRLGGNNQFRETAFYGAEAGMEKLTADVGNEFATQGSLSPADMAAITALPPVIPGIQYLNAAGASTYQILCGTPLVTPCVPVSQNATMLPPSPYAGMQGLITPFTLEVAAQSTSSGAEVKLQRQVQVVAIPVFQFGIYSDSDLSYFNGPPFDFGGRVHTNGNLWLAANSGPLYLADKVTAVGAVIRTNLENGFGITAGGSYSGVVSIAITPNPATLPPASGTNAQWRALALNEGSTAFGSFSVINGVSPTVNVGPPIASSWGNVENDYNGQLQNGVPLLTLTSTALGGLTTPISLIRRPVPGETAAQFAEQYFSESTLRILLDDYPAGVTPGVAGACHNADMMSVQSVSTATDPVDLATLAVAAGAMPGWYSGINNVPAMQMPLPMSGSSGTYSGADGYWIQTAQPMITGCIKIEYQNPGGAFADITQAVLNLGFTGRNINPLGAYVPSTTLPGLGGNVAQGPTTNPNVTAQIGCLDPSPHAIIRIERLRDNPSTASNPGGGCGTATTAGVDYWPMALFDARESIYRPGGNPGNQITAEGVMYYIELDAGNLAAWFNTNPMGLALNNNTGFTIYFSDRRGEQTDPNAANTKTGSFGFDDFVNISDANNGCPNGVVEQGENLEGDPTPPGPILRTYGGAETIPLYPLANAGTNWTVAPLWNGTNLTTVLQANPVCPAPTVPGPLSGTNWPGVVYVNAQEARENPPVFFRRALKIIDGAALNLGTSCGPVPCGLTVVAENPVYIQGDYNAPPDGSWGGASVAAAVAADAVTLLSDNWNDVNSFAFPYNAGSRNAVQTAYRVALIAGKGIAFPQPAGQPQDFGTDGGVHNFLRFLEVWPACYYKGSLVSFYYNRQGTGVYKTGGAVYSPPDRHYSFDQNFTLGPQFLPPRTPSLRSINTIGFSQELLPTQ